MCRCDMKQSLTFIKNLSENRRFILKIKKKVYLSKVERRIQYCLRNRQLACKAVQVVIPLGELKLKFKKWRQHLDMFFDL
jgi:hypothetical protein